MLVIIVNAAKLYNKCPAQQARGIYLQLLAPQAREVKKTGRFR
jgi:hypothetical protein